MKQIVINISKKGDVVVDAQGFAGNECDKAAQHIEIALGGKQKREDKPEYFQPAMGDNSMKQTF